MAEQTYLNHKRFFPLFHFVALPILLINVVVVGRAAFLNPAPGTWWHLVAWIAVLLGFLAVRAMVLTTQDRLIRLEERTRLGGVLPADMRDRASGLTRSQYVALRFAPDEEVPELVRRIHAGELKSSDDIKRAIKSWRADHFRA